jgi:pimeloyl-ACP methyl ester carboxylesterase
VTDERVEFRNARGPNLVGDLSPGGDACVVLCHGFTGDRHEDGRFDITARALNEDGFTVLTFDFSGSGESDDLPITVAGEVEDLRAALAFVRDRGAQQVAVLGLSLGAEVAAHVAADEKIGALVFWAPVTAPSPDPTVWYSREQLDELERTGLITWGKDVGPRRHVVIDGRHLDERRSLDRRALLGGIRTPVLIVHGSRDDLVPLEWSRTALPLLPAGSELRIVRGAGHVFHKQLRRFIRPTRQWFRAWQYAAGR